MPATATNALAQTHISSYINETYAKVFTHYSKPVRKLAKKMNVRTHLHILCSAYNKTYDYVDPIPQNTYIYIPIDIWRVKGKRKQ